MGYNRNRKNNKRRSNKGGSNNRPSKPVNSVERQAVEDNEGKELHNNPSWYLGDPELAKQILSFSVPEFLGEDHPLAPPYDAAEIPSFMQIYLNPSPGWTNIDNPWTAGINVLALQYYTWYSANNAKVAQYQPQDIMMLILSMGQIIAMIGHVKRAFKLAKIYNYRNRNFARNAVEACGFDYDDLIQHYADYRMHLNLVINNLNKIPFVSDIPYFEKCNEIYSHVYQDSESPMGQYYMFIPWSTWSLDEAAAPTGSELKTSYGIKDEEPVLQGKTASVNNFIRFIDTMIVSLLTSSTYNFIYADVLRLTDKENVPLYSMPYLNQDEIETPVYDPMMLHQIHNLNVMDAPNIGLSYTGYTSDNDVVSNPDLNCLEYRPLFATKNTGILRDRLLLDFPHSMGNPDEAQKLELTRLQAPALWTTGEDEWRYATYVALPDHYVVKVRIINNTVSEDTPLDILFYNEELDSEESILRALARLDKFSEHPIAYVTKNAGSGIDHIMTDLDFFTTLPFEWYKDANDFVNLHLYGKK